MKMNELLYVELYNAAWFGMFIINRLQSPTNALRRYFLGSDALAEAWERMVNPSFTMRN